MMVRHRILFVTTLTVTSGLLIAGLIVLATSGLDDLRGRGLCLAATGLGMTYAIGRGAWRRGHRR
ncbi:hypothetical protein GW571_05720 [Clavibacter capsici]|uniref:hypothetical protein n=1 Tax=Clavibacter capsici TaxID=1874630 RepID=UPI00142807D8|nr:hypothetical protein [Clavibacter capsici]QIS40368.1 hypothetical protein GW572_06105 [Clavibacter capsici]QIS43346.1 hypothetical protein GW571_05720 [Clavibacter capsici]